MFSQRKQDKKSKQQKNPHYNVGMFSSSVNEKLRIFRTKKRPKTKTLVGSLFSEIFCSGLLSRWTLMRSILISTLRSRRISGRKLLVDKSVFVVPDRSADDQTSQIQTQHIRQTAINKRSFSLNIDA